MNVVTNENIILEKVADDLTKYLRQDGWPALAIHGDKQQQERDWVLNEFKTGNSPIVSVLLKTN